MNEQGKNISMDYEKNIDRLKKVLEDHNIAMSAAEQRIGVGTGTIVKAARQQRNLSDAVIEKFLKVFDFVNPKWLQTGQGDMYIESKHMENYSNNQSCHFIRINDVKGEVTLPIEQFIETKQLLEELAGQRSLVEKALDEVTQTRNQFGLQIEKLLALIEKMQK